MTDIPTARITSHDVYIDGQKLPGLIRLGGVTVKPAAGKPDGINLLIVKFIVGDVVCEDPNGEANR